MSEKTENFLMGAGVCAVAFGCLLFWAYTLSVTWGVEKWTN